MHGVLKSFFASPLFLITAILFSANLLFQIIASLFPQDPAYIVNQIYSNLPYEMQFIVSPGDLYSALSDAQSGTTVGTVIGMLITGGLMAAAYWITYISAKNPSVPAAKTAGLTIMKVFSIISLVVLSLAEVLCVVLAVIFGVALAGSDYGYMDEMMSGFFIILIAACIIGFVVLIFEIIYEAKVIKMLNSAKNAMLTGMVPNKASIFVAVICFISAAVSFFSVFGDAELKAAFVRLFNPPAAADPYLAGSAAITESEIAQMQAAPDNDVQQEIVRHSSGEAVRCLIARFRLSLAGERALLQRKDKSLLEFYFSRYALYEDAQELLVRTAAKKQERYEILLAYIARHQLCAEALAEAVRRRLQTILEAYLKRYPLGSRVLFFLGLGSSTAEDN